MTTEQDYNCTDEENVVNSGDYVTYNDISQLFKIVKSRGILNETIVIDTYDIANEKLLETGDFIDKVIYHRVGKHYNQSEFARIIGLDPDSYYQYENRVLKLNNVETIEKMINVLDMSEDDLPEYIKFVRNNPIEKIKQFMDKHNISQSSFSRNSNIPLRTIAGWFDRKKDSQISIKNFNKLKAYMGEEI